MKPESPLEKSTRIYERFLKLLSDNELFLEHELKIFSAIEKKYRMKYFPKYVKENDLNYNTIDKKVKDGILPSTEVDEIVFILTNL